MPRDDERPTLRRNSGDGRVPPHNLDAEESLLGALLLSREVVGNVAEMGLTVEHFYKPAHQHVYAAIRGLMALGQPIDVVTVADQLRRDGLLDEIGGPQLLLELQNATPAISNAGALRQDRAGHGRAAAADRRRGRDRRDRLQRTRRRHQGARRGRDEGLRGRRGPRGRLDQAARGPAPAGDGPAAGDVRPRRHDHRCRHRLQRPRRAPLGPPALRAVHRRREAGDGQDGVRARDGHPHRHHGAQAGAVLLARDGPCGADAAHPVRRGARRLAEAAHRPAGRQRLDEDRQGDQPARHPAVPRRQPAGHRDGDPGQGSAGEGALRRDRRDHGRLPPADERRHRRRRRTASSR